MTYLALYGALWFSASLSGRQVQLRRQLFTLFSALLFAFVAFRYQVGCDWTGYANHFERVRYWTTTEAVSSTEPAYWLLLVQLHEWGLEYPYLNLFMAVPFFWGLTALARRQPDPLGFLVLSFPILIINMPMSALRQATAIGFVCLALVAFCDRRLVRYVIMISAGALFHTSAIIFLALAPFVKLPFNRSTLALSGVLVLPGAYFMLSETIDFYADRYVGTGVDAAGAIYRAGMLAIVGGYFLFALRDTYKKRFPADYDLALIGSCIMVATLVIVPISSVISDRFGYYVTPIQLMILARLPFLVRPGPQGQLIAAAPYLALGIVLLYWTQNSVLFAQCYVPYQTWLDWQY